MLHAAAGMWLAAIRTYARLYELWRLVPRRVCIRGDRGDHKRTWNPELGATTHKTDVPLPCMLYDINRMHANSS